MVKFIDPPANVPCGDRLTKRKAATKLWNVVKQVIRDHYDDLKDLRMRDSYYVVRDFLSGDLGEEHIGVDMDQNDYDWFLTNQGYSSYRDDIWTYMEQKEDYVRPRAIPEGVLWDNGDMYNMLEWEEEGIEFIWSRARGFIFVEKRGPAGDISDISDYGWTIITVGKGFPTRLIRALLHEDDRPVLALHDCDLSGEGIYRALGWATRRTAHLDIELGDRVIDLGMSLEDVAALGLPSQPEPPKLRHIRENRYELQGLITLKKRKGIDNPYLDYVIAKMHEAGFTISELEISKKKLFESKVRLGLDLALGKAVRKIMDKESVNYQLHGTAVRLDTFREKIEVKMPKLEKLVKDVMDGVFKDMTWIYEDDRHMEALNEASDEMFEELEIEREE